MNLINCYDLDGNLKVTYALDWIKEEINIQIRVDEHTTVTFIGLMLPGIGVTWFGMDIKLKKNFGNIQLRLW
ncbi:MAG: hypothetical protein ACLTSL_17925 [Odoribacter splanchnicus]